VVRVLETLSLIWNRLESRPAVVFVLLSIVFGSAISVVVPPLRGPDEIAHFLRIRRGGNNDKRDFRVCVGDRAILEIIQESPRSVSMILNPAGPVIGEPLSDSEGIVYAEIDTSRSVEPKQFHDLTGYYNRFDIFNLRFDRSAP